MFWSGWEELGRVVFVGSSAYFGIVLLLRAAGKQALTKMNAYGLVVTVALGSALATAILSAEAKLDKVVLAFVLLLGLQRLLALLSERYGWARRLINNEPTLLVRNGKVLPQAMQAMSVTEEELMAAVRSSGHSEFAHLAAVILETDGSFSIVSSNRPDGD
jgi:uncharacterized membrane protein YcaP (DUF421 family)